MSDSATTPLRVIVAPDKFKGTLTAGEACLAIAAGVRRVVADSEVSIVPLADGGEGTVDAVVAAGGTLRTSVVRGPLGEPTEARWAMQGTVAVIEMAQASGLQLVEPGPRSSLEAETFGTGELLRAALDEGATRIVLGVGGSASTDGGVGALRALGARFFDHAGQEVFGGGGTLAAITRVDASGIDPRLADVPVLLCSDVANPFSGDDGAARVFARQKGATPANVEALDAGLASFADVLRATNGIDLDALGWGGSGGGISGGLHALVGAQPGSGVDIIADLAGLDGKLQSADLAIVGEGSLDEQSLLGKTPVGVARRARAAGIPVLAVAGVSDFSGTALADLGILDLATAVEVSHSVDASLREPARFVTLATSVVLTRYLDSIGRPPRGG